MGKSQQQKELAKLQKKWYNYTQEYHTRQQAGRQHATDARLAEETGNNQILRHKHQSYTIRGPSRLSTSTAYISSAPIPSQVTSNITDSRSSDFFFDFNDNKDITYVIYNEHVAEMTTEPKKRGRTAADNPIGLWLKELKAYLLELLRLEGHGDYMFTEVCLGSSECNGCPKYRCWDCFGTALYCKDCTVSRHRESPLHRIQVIMKHWDDGHFKCTSLKDLVFHDDFVVLDVNGVHPVAIDFCACETAQSSTTQLLRTRWFPATTIDPRTAATFRLLHHFHILTFESKASAFEVWQTLSRLTDNTGLSAPKGWEDAPPEVRWLYGLFLAIDVNFRLARKNVSSDNIDPSLSKGWAYFVEEDGYKAFLQDVSKEPQEKSTCVSHSAVNLAETKNSHGLAATGAGTVDCAHHNFKRPCAVGDLQKGEKYINMDFLFFSMMQHAKDLVTLNVSYDIACQWSKHLWECMAQYPNWMHVEHGGKITTFLVLKFHLPAHIFSCQITYSHNLVKSMGRTDGEAPERRWANINPVATSTREMGLGSRCNTLDDHFGDFNWKKVTNLGTSLLRKLKAAIPECYQHQQDFDEFNETLITERPEEVGRWKQGVEEWEADVTIREALASTKPYALPTVSVPSLMGIPHALCPYRSTSTTYPFQYVTHTYPQPLPLLWYYLCTLYPYCSTGISLYRRWISSERFRVTADMSATNPFSPTTANMTQASVRLTLSQEESEELEHGINNSLHNEISPAVLISSGIGIEDKQAAQSTDTLIEEKAHQIRLFLPSQLKEHAPDAICDKQLCRFEWELRHAQAFDVLNDLCQHLLLCTHLYKFKNVNIWGQRANTRTATVLGKVERNVTEAGERYRRMRTALNYLCGTLAEDGWQTIFPILEPAHVRGMSEGEAGQSEGNQTLSWIWKMQGVSATREVLVDALRIEWCKARARVHRWTEEVQLLLEEM
ncbi:uncharacterized protein EDB91DRAFT_1080407 [Suillus paluster]|uniref:uncharacterized protein n=1 Tax=Suillus paluster TaxID=48578 RepID=UPI001B87D46D|nr:uncharacterized protein EDB91DRAFT_1080407 [Suillus paluster]KAG1745513.1 hypothetical protein EDB91DRAFT_1080407 [Suillus paluster]